MGNMRIVGTNILSENNSFTHTVGTTASGFPVSNMLDNIKSKVWRSTAATTQTLQVTWAASKIIDAIALAFTNLISGSTVRIILYNAEVGGTTLYDSGVMTLSYNYKNPAGFSTIGVSSFAFGGGTYFSHFFTQQTTVRRMTVTIVSSGNPDGYIEVSRLIVGKSWEPDYNPDFGLTWEYDDASEVVRTDAGDQIVNRGAQSKALSFNLNHLSFDDKRYFTEILKQNGSHEPVFASVLPDETGELLQSGQIYGRFDQSNMRYIDYSRFGSSVRISEI